METRTHNPGSTIPEEQHGPAERLLDLVLSSGAHLWHNRVGYERQGKWVPVKATRRAPDGASRVNPGLFVPAATILYNNLLEIYQLNADLMAHFASYALKETEWRDLKVACAALMLVQPLAGQPVRNKRGEVEFCEDDYRAIGEAMLLYYEKDSKRMMTPKAVLRVAQLLEVPEIVELNRGAGFGDPASHKPPLGRWKSAARQWLAIREQNLPMLEGLVGAGLKETIKTIARKAGYKPQSQRFFEILGWPQKQSVAGHRSVGLVDLDLQKRERFDGLSEGAICERIVEQKLRFAEVVGRLPKEVGLTPAIMAALLPSISDRDLRRLTPTLEALDLLADPDIYARWDAAIQAATDQRALNIAKNVKNKTLRDKLEGAADKAVQKAVEEATREEDIHVMFLVDKSGSMQYAIEQSKEALSRILAGFPPEKLHIASFDTLGTVLKPKAPTRAAVQHMLSRLTGCGGTLHAAGVRALHQSGLRIPTRSKLIVIVAGDEAGEQGRDFASSFTSFGYDVAAMALIDCATTWEETENRSYVGRILFGGPQTYVYSNPRGNTVRNCAAELGVPFTDVSVDQFEDPYQVPRVLQTILEAPVLGAGHVSLGWKGDADAASRKTCLMVDYRKFLGQKDRLVLPYFRGSRVEGDRGDFRITDPLEPGFYLFEIRGRTAHRLERVEAPDLSRLTRVRGHVFDRWIVRDSAITEPLHFLPEDEILRFSPLTARRWYSGDLIFESVDFEDDAEEIARRRYADGDSLAGATGVPATLRAAFGYAVVARESRRLAIPFLPIEVRSRILETAQEGNEHAAAHLIGLRRLREAHRRYRGPRRPMVEPRIDVDEARVTAALSDAGARLCDLRRLEGDLLEVTYDFLGARLTTLVRLDSLRVVDAGICLEGADSELTLASLPGVVREAMDTNQLVVTWHEG